MKICPTCRRTYEDDGLNFCLSDGALLNLISNEAAPTVAMNQARPTHQAPGGSRSQTGTAPHIQPKTRSSRSWPWVLGILGLIILVCGGGAGGLFVYIASKADTADATKGPNNSPSGKNTNTFTRGAPSAGDAKEIDLADWIGDQTAGFGTEFVDGEFHMTSKQKGYYYVLVAKRDEYANAPIARVTLRNTSDEPNELGYGLVFHSATTPLTNGYAFLIDTKRKRFRVVRHGEKDEKTVTGWTNSNLIRRGTEPNTLEARDNDEKIELYINDQLATAITNKQVPKGGVPGLYVGDGAKIAFRKLEVVK